MVRVKVLSVTMDDISLFSALAGPVIFICLILIFDPCIINRGIAFIQSRIDAVKLLVLQ